MAKNESQKVRSIVTMERTGSVATVSLDDTNVTYTASSPEAEDSLNRAMTAIGRKSLLVYLTMINYFLDAIPKKQAEAAGEAIEEAYSKILSELQALYHKHYDMLQQDS